MKTLRKYAPLMKAVWAASTQVLTFGLLGLAMSQVWHKRYDLATFSLVFYLVSKHEN